MHIYIHLLIHVCPSFLPSIHPSINKCCTSSQTHFQAASQRPRSLSSYTRERCGRDPISSSDWISGSRRGTQELLTIPPPHYPPFLCLFVSLVLDLFLLWTPVCFPLHPHTHAWLGYSFCSTCNMCQSCFMLFSPPRHYTPHPGSCLLETTSLLELTALLLLCFVSTLSFYTELGGVGGQRGDWGPGSGGKGKGEGSVSMELVGRSGAAPPVIIRVTAARARLCAACTRRDVLPREKCEHLSVPPHRQQPPTSLSNSTQLVTRSPNSYFLSVAHSLTHAHPLWTALHFFSCFAHSPICRQLPSFTLSLFWTGCESSRPLVKCRLQEMSACDI